MQFKYVSGPPASVSTEALALCVESDGARDSQFKAADKALGGRLSKRIKQVEFQGGVGETLVVYSGSKSKLAAATRIVALVGAGPHKSVTPTLLRDLAANAVRAAESVRAKSLGFVIPQSAGKDTAAAAQHAAEGIALATYRFDKYRAKDTRKPSTVSSAVIASNAAKKPAIGNALDRAVAIADSIMLARDFINEPAEKMTPRQLASEARAIAKRHARVSVKILGPAECAKLKMGMFLAVGRGSAEPVQLIHMTYKPPGNANTKKAKKKIALIGKGVTFDSGGYSLKPTASMLDMKIDMSGAAAVIASMDAIARLESPHEVHVIAACAENMVSGDAYRLGDVLTSMAGTTVEINNTDAEGRLTLGDALQYARTKVQPDEVFDFATLTGACLVALGPHTAGVMSNDDKLVKAWLDAAGRSGEDMWQLPLTPRLKEQLKSSIADLRNTGGRAGGAITAGLFLKEFAGDTPWVHVDIAGPASASKASGATAEGAAGFAVATIIEYVTR
jgi:leucyl aminopeptidase